MGRLNYLLKWIQFYYFQEPICNYVTFKENIRTSHTESTSKLGLHRLIQNGGHEDLLWLLLNQIRNIFRSSTLHGNIFKEINKRLYGYFIIYFAGNNM